MKNYVRHAKAFSVVRGVYSTIGYKHNLACARSHVAQQVVFLLPNGTFSVFGFFGTTQHQTQ